MKLLNVSSRANGLTPLSYVKLRHRGLEMTTSNSKQFLVDITEHLIEVNDRSSKFNFTLHVIKSTPSKKAGITIFIHIFQDVNGFDHPSLTEWYDGQHIRTHIHN